MMAAHAGLERRVVAALDAAPSRVPVVLGGCGTGRTTLLHALVDRLGRPSCQYIDVERAASTPERFFHAVFSSSPFVDPGLARGEVPTPSSARDAFDRTLAFFQRARTPDGHAATFLLDEVLELRTFENFPGLRYVLRELVQAVGDSPNRFVCSSRYVARAHRALRDAAARFEVVHLPPLSVSDVAAMLPPATDGSAAVDRDDLAASVQTLADGRAAYVRAIGEATAAMSQRGGDPVSALTALLTTDGALTTWCGYRYELRLQRARGYGALKAILEILAEEEPLTLTEISVRMRRTPARPRTTCRGSKTSTSSSPATSATASVTRCCGCGCGCTRDRCHQASTTSPAKCTPTPWPACPTASPRWPSPAPPANGRAGAGES